MYNSYNAHNLTKIIVVGIPLLLITAKVYQYYNHKEVTTKTKQITKEKATNKSNKTHKKKKRKRKARQAQQTTKDKTATIETTRRVIIIVITILITLTIINYMKKMVRR